MNKSTSTCRFQSFCGWWWCLGVSDLAPLTSSEQSTPTRIRWAWRNICTQNQDGPQHLSKCQKWISSPVDVFNILKKKDEEDLPFAKNKSLALKIFFSICNIWTIMGIKQNFHHDQDDGERLLDRLYQFLQQFAKKLMSNEHCQRHYGPRRWLLWPVILVW